MNVGFIYNPESGSGKIVKQIDWIKQEFIKNGHNIEIYKTEKPHDGYRYALEGHKYDMLLVAGGDGTLNEVVNGLMTLDKRPFIGYLPTGTVNDVGHLLGISRNIKRATKMILKQTTIKAIDISKINGNYFVYAAGTGRFAPTSYVTERKYKKKFGSIAYFVEGSKEIFKDYKIPIKATFDDGTFENMCALVLILNGHRVGGFKLFGMKSKLDDGLIAARFFKREPGMILRMLGFFITGGLYDTRKNKTFHSTYFKIETDDDIDWNTDGELSCKGSVYIKVIPRAIRFVVNHKRVKKYFVK